MTALRLDKYLCDMGQGSRSEVKKLIRKGQVTVKGETVRDPGFQVEEGDQVTLSGRVIAYHAYEYYMLNKPAGVISASRTDLRDQRQQCVVDLIREKSRKDLFPVGRLDKDTVGLLLITNDGALAHDLLSPRKHVEKLYYAELSQPVTEEALDRLRQGVDIGDEKPTLPCRIEAPEGEEEPYGRLLIRIREGRYHQIKRMLEAVGSSVTYLKRLAMGSLVLDEKLPEGGYRRLREEELQALKSAGTLDKP